MIITLPWPDRKLSPNARAHWRVTSHAKKKARRDAAFLALEALQGRKIASDGPLPIRVTFYPPDKRLRDDDNMVGSFKAYRDGIADGLGVNDRLFRPEYRFAEAVKGGRIEVEVIPVIKTANCLPDSGSVLEQSGPQCCDNSTAGLTTNDEVTSHGS